MGQSFSKDTVTGSGGCYKALKENPSNLESILDSGLSYG